MTVKQIQHLLAYLGYYTASVDGIWGNQSSAAASRFQQDYGLPVDGIAGEKTQKALKQAVSNGMPEKQAATDFWNGIRYWKREEFRCRCGGKYCNGFPAEPQELLVRLAERARVHFGKPAHNVSCLRCKTWNAKSGGVANSQHMYGEAMDIRIDGVSGDELLAFFLRQPEVRYAYKINSTNVHFDIPKGAR